MITRRCFFAVAIWCVVITVLATIFDGAICLGQETWPSAEECVTRMTVPPGFEAKLFAAEPDVVNPIAIDFDHRGRMYVLEALQYPLKAPVGQKGLDRIRILEDTDGDHTADKVTLFADGINLGSGLAYGHGGVFVAQPPYVLFLKDTDGDDRADSKEILLEGWDYTDTHATLNSLMFGPDGWLHGNQGFGNQSTVRGNVFHAGFWRYHPQTKQFEIFGEGTSNTWGRDYDENGNFFASVSVIPHLYHVVPHAFHRHPGGYVWSNPYAYGEIDTVVDHRHFPPPDFKGDHNDQSFGGGHAHTGCLIYQGGAFPREYHGRALLNNLHGNRINSDILSRNGSSYVASHGPDFFMANDANFHGIQLKTGPDGSVFVLDWYDSQICHNSDPNVWDDEYGRIYKIVFKEAPQKRPTDLSKLSTSQVVGLLSHPNSWWWRHALLILDERGDASAVTELKELVRQSEDYRYSLRALWALHNIEGLDEPFARETLEHSQAWLRTWAVRFLEEVPANELDRETWNVLWQLAKNESNPDVRLQLVVSAGRWGAGDHSQRLVKLLMQRNEDATDPAVGAMVWLAFEPSVTSSPLKVIDWLIAHESEHPMIRKCILPWTLRRLTESDGAKVVKLPPRQRRRNFLPVPTSEIQNLNLAVATLRRLRSLATVTISLEAMLRGLEGRRLEPPESWQATSRKLANSESTHVQDLARRLGVHFGDPQAVASFEQRALDQDLAEAQRIEAIDALALARHAPSVDPLLRTAIEDPSPTIRSQALEAVAGFESEDVAEDLIANWSRLTPQLQHQTVQILISRKSWADLVLDAIDRKAIPRQALSQRSARRIAEFKHADLNAKLERIWGKLRDVTPQAIRRTLTELRQHLAASPGDRTAGKAVFEKNCMVCHKLYGQGHDVGPDLTGANRRDPEYLLTNIIDPNRAVERAYYAAVVADVSGKIHTGLLVQQTPDRISLRGEQGKVTVFDRHEVDALEISEKSLMPEGLTNNLTAEHFTDLISFLMEDLHLTRGMISKRFASPKPIDESFPVESASHPLQAAADWRTFQIGPAGRIEVDRSVADRYQRPQEGCNYIYAEVTATRDRQTTMIVAFQRGLKVFVNGEVVFRQRQPASLARIPVSLKQGQNELLFKLSNITRNINGPAAAGPSWLRVRFTDPQRQLKLARP